MNEQKPYKEGNIYNNNMLPGDLNRSPDDSFIFIDSGFLSKLSKYFTEGKYITYDLIKFCENLSEKQKLICKKIFYYTAPPFQSNFPTKEERERKNRYDTFIKKLSKHFEIEIREGRCQRLSNNKEYRYSQKAVDSLMVIDLMKVPLRYPNIKKIILIACDTDFVSVVNELKEIGIEIILYTFFIGKRNTNFSRSTYLNNVVTRYIKLTKQDFDNAKLIK